MIPPARASRARTHDETLCINCGCAGHFRSECLAPSRCPTTLAYLGYGVEGGGFYYVHATLEDEPVRPHAGCASGFDTSFIVVVGPPDDWHQVVFFLISLLVFWA